MLNPATNGNLASTNMGVGGALAVVVMATLAVFFPEQAMRIPVGFESGLAVLLVYAITKITPSVKK